MAAAAVALLTLLPLGFVVVRTAAIGWHDAAALLFRPRVGELLSNTASLAVISTSLCAVLGLSVAWCTERTTLPGRHVWAVLAALPMTVPAFVSSFSWVSLTSRVDGLGGAVLIMTLSYFPFVYLPVSAVLRQMDPALEDVARSQGAGPWRTFIRVTLPQTRPALLGGSLLVALHLLSEFGSFDLLRFSTFTTAIYNEYQLSFDGPAAAMLSTILAAICVTLLAAELWVRRRSYPARVGGGSSRPASRYPLGKATPVVVALFAVLAMMSLGVPLGTLAYWLTHGSSVAFPLRDLVTSTVSTLVLGVEAAIVTTACALPIGLIAVRYGGRLATLTERSTYVSQAFPGVIVALALVVVSVHVARPFYQSSALMIVAYAVLFLPLALVAVRPAIAQTSSAVEEMARSLGCGPLQVLWRVTIPLISSGLGAAAALVFLSTATELTATVLLAPIGTQTLAMGVWANTETLAYAAAAPYAALLIAVSAVPTYLLTQRLGGLGLTSAT